jgi:short-subunit dehydrogenase
LLLNFLSTVLITGASRGIGRATAKAFANSGWDLLLLARSEDDLEKLVEEIDNKSRSSTNHWILAIPKKYLMGLMN